MAKSSKVKQSMLTVVFLAAQISTEHCFQPQMRQESEGFILFSMKIKSHVRKAEIQALFSTF